MTERTVWAMHIPKLGSYPLVLRDYDVSNPRDGELLLDYQKYDLYYINRQDHSRVSVAQDIYKRIIDARIQNTNFIVYDNDKIHHDPVSDGKIMISGSVTGTKVITDDSKNTYVRQTTLVLDSSKYIWPPIEERDYNKFYYIVNHRTNAYSKSRSTILDLEKTGCYVINDEGMIDLNGHILVIPLPEIGHIVAGTTKLYLDIDLD